MENNGGDEPNWGMIHVYMEMSQRNPLYNHHILIKMLKNFSILEPGTEAHTCNPSY
jgi:hypothetical protein